MFLRIPNLNLLIGYRKPGNNDSDCEEDNTESKLQQTVLHIHKKFGKNALLKAYDFEECATARQRNAQIGGHKA